MLSTRTSKTKRCHVTNSLKSSKLLTRSTLKLLLKSLSIKLIQICSCKTNKSSMRWTRYLKICEDCSPSTASAMDIRKCKLDIISLRFMTTQYIKLCQESFKSYSLKCSTSNSSWISSFEQVKFKRRSCLMLFLRFI